MNDEIDYLINYAHKEGFIDDEALDWSDKQKVAYYNKCQSYDPEDDLPSN